MRLFQQRAPAQGIGHFGETGWDIEEERSTKWVERTIVGGEGDGRCKV